MEEKLNSANSVDAVNADTTSQTTFYDRFNSHVYKSPTPGRMPFVVWGCNRDALGNDLRSLSAADSLNFVRAIRTAGINCVVIPDNDALIQSCSAGNIKALVKYNDSAEARRRLTTNLSSGKIAGILLADKPSKNELADYQVKSHILKDPNIPLILSRVPEQRRRPLIAKEVSIEKAGIAELPAYDTYLAGVQRAMGPAVWLSDSVLNPPSETAEQETIPTRNMRFFNNLEIMRHIGLLTNRSMWSQVGLSAYQILTPAGEIAKNNMTSRLMLLSAWSGLAYGAQGLVFSDIESRAKSIGSLTDVTTLKNLTSNMAAIITKVANYEAIFLGADHIESFHTDSYYATEPTYSALYNAMTRSLGPVICVSEEGKDKPMDLMFSHLVLRPDKGLLNKTNTSLDEKDMKEFLMIVNKDVYAQKTITLTLSPEHRTYQVLTARVADSGVSYQEKALTSGDVQLTIPAGDSVILRWE